MREIVAGVKDQFDKRLSENSLNNYLNHAAKKDNKSGIISEGPHRGYWLDEDALKSAPDLDSVQEPDGSEEEEGVPGKRTRVKREAALYEPAKQWLVGKSYRAQIIADMRGGAKWSNPDVLGIRVSKNFGLTDIEIASIEVKTGSSNWRQDIFEAIAHKRFANRVYYCYSVTEGLDKLDDELQRYSELYRVGVLQLYLEKNAFATLHSSQSNQCLPDLSTAEIEERIPAPYDFIPPRYQIDFLKGLGLSDEEGLWTFGSDDERLDT